MKTAYDPAAKFELKVSEVEFRRTPAGRQLMARVYQPQGSGPFPTVLDLHGGAWRRKDRLAEEPMDRAIAGSGVLVVAIDLRLSDEAPYPASVQDANYGVRWLKSKAAEWNGDPSKLGVYGSSSGGHVAQLLGMRPRDTRYNAIPFQPQALIYARNPGLSRQFGPRCGTFSLMMNHGVVTESEGRRRVRSPQEKRNRREKR